MTDLLRHRKSVEAETAKLRAQVLRSVKRRLRELERKAGINFIAFRLGIQYGEAERLLYGDKPLTLENMSDLALAVGCRLEPKVRKPPKSVALRKRAKR